MTIKQQGGIFGRNPTFNDVTSASATTNDLTVNANGTGITISGNNTSSGSKNNLRFVDTDASVASGQQVGRIEFYTSDAGNEGINAYIEGRDGSSSGSGSIVLGAGNSGAAVDRLELVSGGNLNLLTGNLVIGTSGKGIDFSATSGTGTSELFDDYEEGTWTVELYDAASGGNVSPTTATGYYTKMGRQVSITFSLSNIDTTGMTSGNQLYFTLPFTAGFVSAGSLVLESFALASGRTWVSSWVNAADARGRFRQSGDAVTAASLTVGTITSGTSDIERCTLTYGS